MGLSLFSWLNITVPSVLGSHGGQAICGLVYDSKGCGTTIIGRDLTTNSTDPRLTGTIPKQIGSNFDNLRKFVVRCRGPCPLPGSVVSPPASDALSAWPKASSHILRCWCSDRGELDIWHSSAGGGVTVFAVIDDTQLQLAERHSAYRGRQDDSSFSAFGKHPLPDWTEKIETCPKRADAYTTTNSALLLPFLP